jgi:hypothetical protein
LVVGAILAGLVAAFGLRRRLPGAVIVALLGACGAGLAWGGLLLLDGSPAEYAVLVPLMAGAVPFHAWVVLRPLGRP